MLKRLYDKSKILFSVAWIIAYCVLMSAGDALSAQLGVEKAVTLPVGLLLSTVLFLFLRKHGLLARYGFCAPRVSARAMLWYLPVVLMLTANLWYGVTANYGVGESVLYVCSMLCVGFLEEVIFRGLLFLAMCEENVKAAVTVSSVTFGIGHIINLINGSGAELLPNLLQVIYATAAGFMFVMLFYKTKSLIVCILAHGLFNALSVFANEASATTGTQILFAIALTVITGLYGTYIALTMKNPENRMP
ncbi:MAG: CPBP family intramembrane metalloprotease [Clostridia bacterium]|nr:CPBP family intramembrane metalloprotease [Clostridia bacterium]